MESKERIRYDRALLDKCLERDGATLVGEYEKITCETKFKFVCKCGVEEEKNFRVIYKNAGMFCKNCSTLIGNEKLRHSILKTKSLESIKVQKTPKTKFDKKLLDEIIAKYGATLIGDYTGYIDNRTQIKYACKCSEIHTKIFNSIVRWGGAFCKKCGEENRQNNIKNTNMEKYGCVNPFQNEQIKIKIKDTLQTKYGVDHPMKLPAFKEKIKHTTFEKYGVDHLSKLPEHQTKIRDTNLKKYGVESHNQLASVQRKKEETSLKNYGVKYANQSVEHSEMVLKTSKKYKEFKMPSGIIRKVQGYEPFAITELLKTYTEDQIKTDRKDVGFIKYKINDKEKYYFPDIYIPHENKIIEVKSSWTICIAKDNIQAKAEATKAQGYNYEIWCFNKKGERVDV